MISSLASSRISKAGEGTGSVWLTKIAPSLRVAAACATLPINSSSKHVLFAKTTSPVIDQVDQKKKQKEQKIMARWDLEAWVASASILDGWMKASMKRMDAIIRRIACT